MLEMHSIRNVFGATSFASAALMCLSMAAHGQTQTIERLQWMFPMTAPFGVVVAGDLDRDGDVDLYAHGHGYAWPGLEHRPLFLNSGNGRFVPGDDQLPPLDNHLTSMALGDVDGDQDLDLLIGHGDGNLGGGSVELRLNDGNGGFSPAPFPNPGDTTMSVAFGDTDGDGDLDAVVGNGAAWDLSGSGEQSQLFLNDGKGNFVDATSRLPRFNCDTQALILIDVDADQDLDLVLANGGHWYSSSQLSRLYLNNGSGWFKDATEQLPAHSAESSFVVGGDVDGDSDADLIFGDVGTPPRMYRNDGAGVFSDASGLLPAHFSEALDLHLADLDLDGDLDLTGSARDLLGSRKGFVALNDGNGVFTDVSSTHLPEAIESYWWRPSLLTDLDGDADPDSVFLGSTSADGVRFNDGSGRLLQYPDRIPDDLFDPYLALSGDLNGDHDIDIVAGNYVLTNDGAGWFSRLELVPGDGEYVEPLALGDVDQDLDLDLFAYVGYQQKALLLNNGAGSFYAAPVQPPLNENSVRVDLGDVDADSDLDALIASYGGQTRLLLNDGGGVFTDATAQMPHSVFFTCGAALADLDGDGDLDIFLENHNAPARLYLNDGSGHFTDASAQFPDVLGYLRRLLIGDVDGDGDLDVVLSGAVTGQSGQLELYLNDGNASFVSAPSQVPVLDVPALSERLVDLQNDGDLDLLIMGSRSSLILLNDGQGVFSDPARSHPTTAYGGQLAVGDFDRDGDDDAFVAVNADGGSWLWSNLARQVAWREIPRLGVPLIIDLHGKPWRLWLLFGGRRLQQTPFPPFGTLQIAPQSAFFVGAGQLDSTGKGSLSIPMPSSPAAIGVTFYLQAFIGPPWKLSNVERVTLTGF